METISSETELISEAKAREIVLGLVNTTPTTKTQVIGEAKAK